MLDWKIVFGLSPDLGSDFAPAAVGTVLAMAVDGMELVLAAVFAVPTVVAAGAIATVDSLLEAEVPFPVLVVALSCSARRVDSDSIFGLAPD